jgi:triosephosphate isomerase (TIM)
MRKQIAAANWKMNLTIQQGTQLVKEILSEKILLSDEQLTLFAVPFPYLALIQEQVKGNKNFGVAAQNCYYKKSGAFTGEISAEMLQSIGLRYCLVGHSERREYFSETNAMLAEKINLCLANNIVPIFCCGEPLAIREAETQSNYVETQLKESLFHLSKEQLKLIVIAYEPIWAIGTGKTATTQQAQDMHAFIRTVLAGQFGGAVADEISILYGGSVKASNAPELFGCKDVDGGLVGGASLVATEFVSIIRALKK